MPDVEQHLRSRHHRRSAVMLIVAAVALAISATPAAARDVRREELLVMSPSGDPLDEGGGATEFAIGLPDEASCPGDSANDFYRVDSYMLPIAVEPADVLFTAAGPEPTDWRTYESFRQPLYDVGADSYAADFTAERVAPGEPGRIVNVPTFSFTAFVDNYSVPHGAYRMGIACTLRGEVTNVWETTIEITLDETDEPVGIAWVVTGSQPEDLKTARSSFPSGPVQVLLAVAGVLAAAAFLLRRSSRSAPERVSLEEAR